MKAICTHYAVVMLRTVSLTQGFALLSAPVQNHGLRRIVSPLHTSLDDASSYIPDDTGSGNLRDKSIELWLDLRGTAIHPRAAVEYLQERVLDDPDYDTDSPIDFRRILVSDNMFQKLLNSGDDYTPESEILYVPKETPTLVAASRAGLSVPFGALIAMEDSVAVADPVTAMETLSGGQWIVLSIEEDEMEDEDSRIAAVSSFVEIASSASGDWASATQSESGLLLQTRRAEEGCCPIGGIAVQCPTKSSIIQLASTIESIVGGKSTTSTKSGILIQSETGRVSSLPFALLMPFDASMWQVALAVYGKLREE
eukprot:scaffold743_cov117-Cylindrotheca_fusiformis.AAC.10